MLSFVIALCNGLKINECKTYYKTDFPLIDNKANVKKT